jgi:integrase
VKRGLIARNPVKDAETPRDPEAEIEPYTTDQMAALLATARGKRNAARWTVAMALGLRQGEVLGLCWDDLHVPSDAASEGTLTVRRQLQRVTWRHGCPQRWGGGLKPSPPKSEAGRRKLVVPATLTSELRAHRKEQLTERLASEVWEPGPSGGWVFTDDAGRPIDPRADNRAFKDLCRSAGLPERRLHDLRHSAATMMLDSDVDLKTAGHLLGHSRVAQTERYQHVLADRKSVAAARIDQALFGQRRRQS